MIVGADGGDGDRDGVVEADRNDPGAEIWGVGKSKL